MLVRQAQNDSIYICTVIESVKAIDIILLVPCICIAGMFLLCMFVHFLSPYFLSVLLCSVFGQINLFSIKCSQSHSRVKISSGLLVIYMLRQL